MIEWDQPGRLNTPIGDLPINQEIPGVGWFMVDAEKADCQRALRVTSDSVPQGDGRILHRRFSDGIELTLPIQLWKTTRADAALGEGEKACGEDLRVMLETLGLYVQAILNGRGRWFWTPSGYGDDRMLDECRWLVPFKRELADGLTTVTFGIDSQFPYFIDATEQTVSLVDGVPSTIANDGTHDVYPVIEANGPATTFEIENASILDDDLEPLKIVYDATRPGGQTIGSGDDGEINVFKNTIYLNGNETNLKPGVDPEETDYFILAPGDNTITATGISGDVKFNNAWVPT